MASVINRKTMTKSQLVPHDEFIKRIRKSLYFGDDSLSEDLEISRPLAEYSAELFSESHRGHSLNRLHSVAAGSLHATPCSLLMALIYLERMNVTDPGFLRRITPQELFIVSMMISTKLHIGLDEDIYFSNWAEEGNISEKRLKRLELEFLNAIEWNIYVSNEQFFEKLKCVEGKLARQEGLKRGWLTYTELVQMLPSLGLAKYLLQQFIIISISYTASILTLTSVAILANQICLCNKELLSSLSTNRTTVEAPKIANDFVPMIPLINEVNTSCIATSENASITLNSNSNSKCEFINDDTDIVENDLTVKPAHTLLDIFKLFKAATDGASLLNKLKYKSCNESSLIRQENDKQNFGCHCFTNAPSKNCILWHIFSDVVIDSWELLAKF